MGYRGYNFDALLNLQTAGVITASGAGTVSGAAQVLDVGTARFEGVIDARITALSTTNGNETYDLILQGSNDATLATGVEELASMKVTQIGRVEIPFVNRKYETQYRYLRLMRTLAGTSPSLNMSAFISTLKWN